MKSNDESKARMHRFLSIKTKFLAIYCGLLFLLVLAVTLVLPMIFNQYFVTEKNKELTKVRSLVSDILSQGDYLINEHVAELLQTTAESSDVSIWVCRPINDNVVRISVFGQTENGVREIDFSKFSAEEKYKVENVLVSGHFLSDFNVFPTAFSARTLTVGYRETYVESSSVVVGNTATMIDTNKNGAVFLNVAMTDINLMSRSLQQMVLIMLMAIALAATIMTGLMGNTILTPVQEMTAAAKAISKGDFTQEVEVKSHDEIGELTESFNHMSKELQAVDTLQSDFIANISHDFRSPLTSIKGYVEAMLDGTIPPEMFSKYLQIVLDESNRLTKMTNNVLDLTKMENGQIELHRVNFDINEMIVTLALSLEQRVNEHKIKMKFQFLQEKLYVNADLDLIQRVIYNLLDNALKFTSEGDSITIETSVVGKKAYIVVSDTGSGIEESALPHVFERFNKGDKSRGKNKMGTGLGLAIVKQIMLTHNEDIKVYSKVGEGTKFAFTLPLAYKFNLVEKK